MLVGVLAVTPQLLELPVVSGTLGSLLSVKILVLVLIFAFASQAWNLMSGFAGQFSFGHAAYFGIGAYATQKLLIDFSLNPWLGMLLGGLVAVAYGLVIGGLSIRYDISGHYFALVTLAFAELLRLAVKNVGELNGALGYYRPFAEEYAAGPGLAAFQFNADLPYYYVILAFLALVTAVSLWLRHSQYGLYLFAIKSDEDAAASAGIPVARFKLLSIGLSTFFTAWAGAYWSMYFTTIEPSTVFGIMLNVEILLPAIVGGIGTVFGPVIGAILVIPISEFARTTFDNVHGLHQGVYAVVLIGIGIFLPGGVTQLPDRIRELIPGDRTGDPRTESDDRSSVGETDE